jgi:hypothetical protein
MDPNVLWQTIRTLIVQDHLSPNDRMELVASLEALAVWIHNEGFLPCPFEAQEEGDQK